MAKPYDFVNEIQSTLSAQFVHGTDASLTLTSVAGFPTGGGYIRVGDYDATHWVLYEYTGIATNDLTGLTACTLGVVETDAAWTFPIGTVVGVENAAEMVKDVRDEAVHIKVTNSSGATVAAGDVGYLDADGEYQRTTTALDTVPWCVVTTGGADAATIYVKRRGVVTVDYTGSDPSKGDYLVTSATGGSAQAQTTLRSEIFAVCLAAGSSGSVEVLLLTQRTFSLMSNAADILRPDTPIADSDFAATITGAVTTTSLTYTGESGDPGSFDPDNANHLGKFVLHNTTRSTSRLVTAVDTVGKVITTEATTDSWVATDSISMRSLINTDTSESAYFFDIDLSNASAGSLFARAVGIQIWVYHSDSGAPNNNTGVIGLHPYEAYAGPKFLGVYTGEASIWFTIPITLSLIDKMFTLRVVATGAGTANYIMRLQGIWEATP